VLGRAIAIPLSKQLGRQVVVENKPGAGTAIAGDFIVRSAPDGYTLWLQDITTHAINAALYAKLPYDSMKDFSFVAMVASTPLMLVVHPSTPAHTVRELIALLKSGPGKYSYGSSGNGTIVFSTMPPAISNSRAGKLRALVRRINAEFAKAVQAPEMQPVWQNIGADPIAMTPEELEGSTAAEIAKLAPVVKASGAKLE
jgi:tripartite-type tricarboxylate transporter receptor subunit TctC